ncbi:macrophage mannose receptor 1-like [Strongylocentrotus purpuratus]|uniref:C-type lectin domain-containing protein n=1 Tax=Strongylocentrotus purpuratus TaxID=7668 RepID=A0A7M7T2Q5_STRPU|nr:macrophage mannose receptor 1-like [Strongylocentrotus purpuratus]
MDRNTSHCGDIDGGDLRPEGRSAGLGGWGYGSNHPHAMEFECQECSSSGLDVFGGYQYLFYHGNDGIYRTFSATRALCQSLGGDMPIITSAEQNDFIAGKLLTYSNRGNYYIGLEDIIEGGTYRWIDGTALGYTNWDSPLYTDPNQPPPYCAVMRSQSSLTDPVHGRWNRVTCTSERRHICQIPIDVGCRWQELGESQYLIKFTPRATPNDARETCQSYGGDLAIIKTAEVNMGNEVNAAWLSA